VLIAQEAADTGTLYKPQFQSLNMYLAVVGLAHLFTMVPLYLSDHGGPLMPYVLGMWAAATAVGAVGSAAQPPPPHAKA
jgi:hypothetical protein